MTNLEKIWCVGVGLAILGIVAFWLFGFNNNLKGAEYCLVSAGISTFIAIAALIIHKLHNRNFCY